MFILLIIGIICFVVSIVLYITLGYNVKKEYSFVQESRKALQERMIGMSDDKLQNAYTYYKTAVISTQIVVSNLEKKENKTQKEYDKLESFKEMLDKYYILRDLFQKTIKEREKPSQGKGGNKDIIPPEIPIEMNNTTFTSEKFVNTTNKILFVAAGSFIAIGMCLCVLSTKF
jgi:hypothetical protein